MLLLDRSACFFLLLICQTFSIWRAGHCHPDLLFDKQCGFVIVRDPLYKATCPLLTWQAGSVCSNLRFSVQSSTFTATWRAGCGLLFLQICKQCPDGCFKNWQAVFRSGPARISAPARWEHIPNPEIAHCASCAFLTLLIIPSIKEPLL